jgi:hypothetical protein
MHQIADWLAKLGVSEYARRFAENRINFSVLPDLTDQALEKPGVVLGDPCKILRGVAYLEAWKSAPVATAVCTKLGDAPVFVEVGEAGIAVDHAMRRELAVQCS